MENATKERGYFIVTAVHTTRRCHIKCWSRGFQHVLSKATVHINPVPIGSAEVSTSNSTQQALMGWVSCPSEDDQVYNLKCL